MNLYSYEGPVMLFDRCVAQCWQSSTYAQSEKKAKSNLAYQYKKQNNLAANAKINLPGKIAIIEDDVAC